MVPKPAPSRSHGEERLFEGNINGEPRRYDEVRGKEETFRGSEGVALSTKLYGTSALRDRRHPDSPDLPKIPIAHGPVFSQLYSPHKKDAKKTESRSPGPDSSEESRSPSPWRKEESIISGGSQTENHLQHSNNAPMIKSTNIKHSQNSDDPTLARSAKHQEAHKTIVSVLIRENRWQRVEKIIGIRPEKESPCQNKQDSAFIKKNANGSIDTEILKEHNYNYLRKVEDNSTIPRLLGKSNQQHTNDVMLTELYEDDDSAETGSLKESSQQMVQLITVTKDASRDKWKIKENTTVNKLVEERCQETPTSITVTRLPKENIWQKIENTDTTSSPKDDQWEKASYAIFTIRLKENDTKSSPIHVAERENIQITGSTMDTLTTKVIDKQRIGNSVELTASKDTPRQRTDGSMDAVAQNNCIVLDTITIKDIDRQRTTEALDNIISNDIQRQNEDHTVNRTSKDINRQREYDTLGTRISKENNRQTTGNNMDTIVSKNIEEQRFSETLDNINPKDTDRQREYDTIDARTSKGINKGRTDYTTDVVTSKDIHGQSEYEAVYARILKHIKRKKTNYTMDKITSKNTDRQRPDDHLDNIKPEINDRHTEYDTVDNRTPKDINRQRTDYTTDIIISKHIDSEASGDGLDSRPPKDIDRQREYETLETRTPKGIIRQRTGYTMDTITTKDIDSEGTGDTLDTRTPKDVDRQRDYEAIDNRIPTVINRERTGYSVDTITSKDILKQREYDSIDTRTPKDLAKQRTSNTLDTRTSKESESLRARYTSDTVALDTIKSKEIQRNSSNVVNTLKPNEIYNDRVGDTMDILVSKEIHSLSENKSSPTVNQKENTISNIDTTKDTLIFRENHSDHVDNIILPNESLEYTDDDLVLNTVSKETFIQNGDDISSRKTGMYNTDETDVTTLSGEINIQNVDDDGDPTATMILKQNLINNTDEAAVSIIPAETFNKNGGESEATRTPQEILMQNTGDPEVTKTSGQTLVYNSGDLEMIKIPEETLVQTYNNPEVTQISRENFVENTGSPEVTKSEGQTLVQNSGDTQITKTPSETLIQNYDDPEVTNISRETLLQNVDDSEVAKTAEPTLMQNSGDSEVTTTLSEILIQNVGGSEAIETPNETLIQYLSGPEPTKISKENLAQTSGDIEVIQALSKPLVENADDTEVTATPSEALIQNASKDEVTKIPREIIIQDAGEPDIYFTQKENYIQTTEGIAINITAKESLTESNGDIAGTITSTETLMENSGVSEVYEISEDDCNTTLSFPSKGEDLQNTTGTASSKIPRENLVQCEDETVVAITPRENLKHNTGDCHILGLPEPTEGNLAWKGHMTIIQTEQNSKEELEKSLAKTPLPLVNFQAEVMESSNMSDFCPVSLNYNNSLTEKSIGLGQEAEVVADIGADMESWVDILRNLETPEIMKCLKVPRQPRTSALSIFATLSPIQEDQVFMISSFFPYDFAITRQLNVEEDKEVEEEEEPEELKPSQEPGKNISYQEDGKALITTEDEPKSSYSLENSLKTTYLVDTTSPLEMLRKHLGDENSKTAGYRALPSTLLLSDRLEKKSELIEYKTYSRLSNSLLFNNYKSPIKDLEKEEESSSKNEQPTSPVPELRSPKEDNQTLFSSPPISLYDHTNALSSPSGIPEMADTGSSSLPLELNRSPSTDKNASPPSPLSKNTEQDTILPKLTAFPDSWEEKDKEYGKLNPRPGKIVIFLQSGFRGKQIEIISDVPDATAWTLPHSISIRVVRGGWIMYEKPRFQGRKCVLAEGDIELTDPWNDDEEEKEEEEEEESSTDTLKKPFHIGSLRHVVKDYGVPEISLFSKENGEGTKLKFHDMVEDIRIYEQPIKASSIIVHAGLWLLYNQPFFEGDPSIVEPGGFPSLKAWDSTDPNICSLQPIQIGGLSVEKPNEPKVIIYVNDNFQGRSCEVNRDIHDLRNEKDAAGLRLSSVGSLQVLGGCWVGYQKEGFRGQQYLLEEGGFNDWKAWGGSSKELASLRPIRTDFSDPALIMYAETDSEDTPCIQISDALPDVELANYGTATKSIHVLSGVWVAYSDVNFSGEQYILEKGMYRSCQDWGSSNCRISSLQPVLQVGGQSLHYTSKIHLFSEPDFKGTHITYEDDRTSLPESFNTQSCRVRGGSWILYSNKEYSGEQYVLCEGQYPTCAAMGCLSEASVWSLRKVPLKFSEPSISLHGLECFEGKEIDLNKEVRSLQAEGFNNHVLSLRVKGGIWVLYEHSDFRGRQWLLDCKEITSWLKYSGLQQIGSLRPIRQKRIYFHVRNEALQLFLCVREDVEEMKAGRVLVSEPSDQAQLVWYYEEGYIKNQVAPTMSLQVIGAADKGAKVVLWSQNRLPSQTWRIEPNGHICSEMFQNMILDIKGGEGYDQDHVVLWEKDDERPSQIWKIEVL
ncbi:beta/gamma crystallin domain-containing protein 2 [Microcaecilia unicolor]|uniref:Beta/gamma crystallin domain-containing protein 2 n=1 Tax=Microcaecilia unicolor TaxID=1415580 RepID=A0A6P7Z9V1_9AMPH|nr:beta/gamma crystallin domain-containing protein 2 [Microcaecilia unicolor]